MWAMDRWEEIESVQPELLSMGGADYQTVLKWCAEYKTKPGMLSTGVTCILYFLVNTAGEVLGGMVINHGNTRRGHLHAGIVPWRRGEGLGTQMLKLSLDKCREMGLVHADIVHYKGNTDAVQTILKNGGALVEEFSDNGRWSQRWRIAL